MKFQKTVEIKYGTAEGNFQRGQYGKDEHGQSFRYYGKDIKHGNNVWLLVEYFNYYNEAEKKSFQNRLKQVKRMVRRKPEVIETCRTKTKRSFVFNENGNLIRNGG